MEDLTGQKFGRLTVLRFVEIQKGKGRMWCCVCDCGTECIRSTGKLQEKGVKEKSCGCAQQDSIRKAAAAAWKVTTKFSHPLKKKLRWMYVNMARRCHKPGTRRYDRYGGRGITVCDEWRSNPTAFFEWAVAAGFKEGLSIERKDRDGNYCPDNCRFATQSEQANNTSRNRFLTWNGKTQTVSQWAREIGVRPQALEHRVNRGWTVEKIFQQPFRKS